MTFIRNMTLCVIIASLVLFSAGTRAEETIEETKTEKKVESKEEKKEKKVETKKEKEDTVKEDKAAKAKAEKEAKEKAKADKAEKVKAKKEAKEKAKADKTAKAKAEKEAKEKAKADKAEKIKAEKEAKEKAKADKAAKGKADKEAKAKAKKEKQVKTTTKTEGGKEPESVVEKESEEETGKVEKDEEIISEEKEDAERNDLDFNIDEIAEKEDEKVTAEPDKAAKEKKDKKGSYKKAHAKAAGADIAVYDLNTTFAADRKAALIISDHIRTELINAGIYTIMEYGEMKNVLEEQVFQFKDTCRSQSCISEAGHFLGVSRVIYGSIANVNGFYTVVLRMLNVPRGEILCTATEDLEGDIVSVISQKAEGLVRKLINEARKKEAKTVVEEKSGVLHIDADRAGATIEIDGKMVDEKTPTSIENLAIGSHRIVVRDSLGFGSKTVVLGPEETMMVTIPLHLKKSELSIISRPSEARIFIDGEDFGKTPFKMDKVVIGEHHVQLKKEGFFPAEKMVAVSSEGVTTLEMELVGIAYLTVKAKPKWADIVINGKTAGKGVVESYEVPAGKADIHFEASAYELKKVTVTLKAGEKKVIEKELSYLFATLNVETKPAEASFFIDDVEITTMPFKNNLMREGTYKLTLEEDTYDSITEDIVISPGSIVKREYTLKHTEWYRDSIVRAKWKKKGYRKVRRVVFGALGAVCGAAGLYFHWKGIEYNDDYNVAHDSYMAAGTDEDINRYRELVEASKKNAETNYTRANIFYTAAGVLFGGFVISIPF